MHTYCVGMYGDVLSVLVMVSVEVHVEDRDNPPRTPRLQVVVAGGGVDNGSVLTGVRVADTKCHYTQHRHEAPPP